MDTTRTITSRRAFVEHMLRVMHTANIDDTASYPKQLDWIDAHYDRTHEGRIGLGHTLHNAMSHLVRGMLTPEELEVYDDVGSGTFGECYTDMIKD